MFLMEHYRMKMDIIKMSTYKDEYSKKKNLHGLFKQICK